MAWLLALLFILTAVMIVGGIAGNWVFPAAITDLARQFDDQFLLTILITGFFFVLMHVILAYIVLRFQEGRGTASYWFGNIKWVWATVAVMAVVDLSLAFGSESIWHKLHLAEDSSTAIRIEVVAQQFVWNVRYSGPDGQFGRVSRDLVDDALNPLGIDPADPAGKDDMVQPTLMVPVGREIILNLESKDVIHSFFVPELRMKQDAVQGLSIPLRFTPDTPGRYEIACAELCGLGHHQMRSFLDVLDTDEYESRLQELTNAF